MQNQKQSTSIRWEHVITAEQMQSYIRQHLDEGALNLEELYRISGYSRRHADRIFHQLLGKTPEEYFRSLRLTQSAHAVAETEKSLLQIALDAEYESHDGFTRAFTRQFGITPSEYRRGNTPIPLYLYYPITHQFTCVEEKELDSMKQMSTCTITVVSRPERKLMVQYSKSAKDYWSYCEEKGCDWDGLLNSLPSKMASSAILELPVSLQKEGYSSVAAGVELPVEYGGKVPDGFELITLPPCEMMYFQSQPYEDEGEYSVAIQGVLDVIDHYRPEQYGYTFALELAPRFNFGASTEMGAKLAVPVKQI